jgi:dihydrofolate reductase
MCIPGELFFEAFDMIGGASIYAQTIEREGIDGIYLTRIMHDFNCDVFFPEIPKQYTIKQKIGYERENDIDFAFYLYRKKIHEPKK